MIALRVTLRVADRYGELEGNPCAGVTIPAGQAERPARVLGPDEAARIVAAAERDDERFGRSFAAPLVALALGTGLRLGELLALPWGADGLDLDEGILHVRRAVDRDRDATGRYPFVPPKSRASRRDVPLTPEDAARLRRHRLANGRPGDGALVFADRNGNPLAANGLPRAAWARILQHATVAEPLPRFHDLRHSFATHALAVGLTAHAVAELLGHSDAGLVWRRYGHALRDEVARAGETLSLWRQRRLEAV